jgi:pyrophosphatase PpaX
MRDSLFPPSAVLFDLDGTLIDTVELIVRSFQHTTAYHLGAPLERAAVVATIGRPLHDCLEELAPGRGADLYATYREFNRAQHDALVQPVPEALEAVCALWERGYRLGLVTSKSRDGAGRAIARYALARLLDVIVCLEDTVHHKPAPDPLLHAAAQLGLAPGEALYVGDSTFDVLSAQAAGMPMAAVLWGAGTEAALSALHPDYLLGTPGELLNLLPAWREAPGAGAAVGPGPVRSPVVDNRGHPAP